MISISVCTWNTVWRRRSIKCWIWIRT